MKKYILLIVLVYMSLSMYCFYIPYFDLGVSGSSCIDEFDTFSITTRAGFNAFRSYREDLLLVYELSTKFDDTGKNHTLFLGSGLMLLPRKEIQLSTVIGVADLEHNHYKASLAWNVSVAYELMNNPQNKHGLLFGLQYFGKVLGQEELHKMSIFLKYRFKRF